MAQTTSQIAWIEGLSPADPPRRGLEFLPLVGRKSSANDFFERAIAHYMNDFEVRKRPDWPAGLLYIARRVHLLPANAHRDSRCPKPTTTSSEHTMARFPASACSTTCGV